MKEQIKEVHIRDLIFDGSLYPRKDINGYQVSSYVEAMRAGSVFPPILVDSKSKRIVDGVTRWRAYQSMFNRDRVKEENRKISIIEKKYKNAGDMFEDAIKLNTAHGLSIYKADRKKCIRKLQEYERTMEEISSILKLTIKTINEALESEVETGEGEKVNLKSGLKHLGDNEKKITKDQEKYNNDFAGNSIGFHIQQVIGAIKAECINYKNENEVYLLKELRILLNEMNLNKICYQLQNKYTT